LKKIINLTKIEDLKTADLFNNINLKDLKNNSYLIDINNIITHSSKISFLKSIIEVKKEDNRDYSI